MCQRVDNRVLPGARGGFTLTEVLIVVAILALMAVGLVGVTNYVNTQGNVALTRQCLLMLSAAVEDFYTETGHFPIKDTDWVNRNDPIILPGCRLAGATSSGTPASDELLYLQLSLLPQTRKIISKLPGKLLAAPHNNITVTLGGQQTPYLRSIVDPWGLPLDYDTSSGSFPKIWSFGPDGKSASVAEKVDDITNED